MISMNRAISDVGAIKFAASFYGALAFGRSVKKAFDQGLARLKAEGISESETPELIVRAGVDPSALLLVGPRERVEANQPKVARTRSVPGGHASTKDFANQSNCRSGIPANREAASNARCLGCREAVSGQ